MPDTNDEEEHGPPMASPDQLPSPEGTVPIQPSALANIDARLANADVREIILLTRVRGEFIRQDEHTKDQGHLRKMEAREVTLKAGLSLVAVAAGTVLVLAGFSLPGSVALGAGLYWLAPSLIDRVAKRVLHGGKNDD